MLDRFKKLLETGKRTVNTLSDRYNPLDSDYRSAKPVAGPVRFPGIRPDRMSLNNPIDRVNSRISDLNANRLPEVNIADYIRIPEARPVEQTEKRNILSRAGDFVGVEMNIKYAKKLLKDKVLLPMDFDETQQFFVEQAEKGE